jgi:hypothetical protein
MATVFGQPYVIGCVPLSNPDALDIQAWANPNGNICAAEFGNAGQFLDLNALIDARISASGGGSTGHTLTDAEYSAFQSVTGAYAANGNSLGFGPMAGLSTDDGALIGGAVLAVWALAWGFRMLRLHISQLF